jgi:hypothetical protein
LNTFLDEDNDCAEQLPIFASKNGDKVKYDKSVSNGRCGNLKRLEA